MIDLAVLALLILSWVLGVRMGARHAWYTIATREFLTARNKRALLPNGEASRRALADMKYWNKEQVLAGGKKWHFHSETEDE